jgi:hypothetical protein
LESLRQQVISQFGNDTPILKIGARRGIPQLQKLGNTPSGPDFLTFEFLLVFEFDQYDFSGAFADVLWEMGRHISATNVASLSGCRLLTITHVERIVCQQN